MATNEEMIATVDLGSNSFRLQICRNDGGKLRQIDSIKEMVRFASGLDDKKMLSRAIQQSALETLGRFGERLRGFKPAQVRVVATNTFRVARNIQGFIEQAEKALGFPIEVIAGREEARLIYLGISNTVDFGDDNALIFDIGGGSTEFIVGHGPKPALTESVNMGCVTYGARFFPDGKVTADAFEDAVNAAKNAAQTIVGAFKREGWKLALCSSGSARAIRDVIEAREGRHLAGIEPEALKSLRADLIAAGGAKRAKLPSLKPERFNSFPGGLAIMAAVFELFGLRSATVTDAALREGVFYDLIGRKLGRDMRDETVEYFANELYRVDRRQADEVKRLALKCFSGLSAQTSKSRWENMRRFLGWACELHEIGMIVSHMGYHKHSSYLARESDMPGFSRLDQRLLSTLLLGHRGELAKMRALVDDELTWAALLCMRLAVIFGRGRILPINPGSVFLQINMSQGRYVLKAPTQWLQDNPLTCSALRQEIEEWRSVGHSFKIERV